MLSVQSLGCRFGALWAVRDVTLTVSDGEIVGIIGPNGAGKSTLFNIVAGAIAPTAGRVDFMGVTISGRPAYAIARLGLARTFQIPKPFKQLSVRENVMLSALRRHRVPRQTRGLVDEIMTFVGIERFAETTAGNLTVGLLKKLEVARALATEPRLVLLDEVMAGLTPAEIKEMMAVIASLPGRNVTVLWVEHVMAAIMNVAQRIVVLHHGAPIAVGPPTAVAHDPAVIKAYLGETYLHAAPS
jgi:branched-chain amino acid transport system ATP-binding protein